jgi:hypothetical protein
MPGRTREGKRRVDVLRDGAGRLLARPHDHDAGLEFDPGPLPEKGARAPRLRAIECD